MPAQAHIAIDIGAESGRVIVGTVDNDRVSLHECHRFGHTPVPTPTGLCWDLTGLWREILAGLQAAAAYAETLGLDILSVGVDTWAIDYTLVSKGGELLGLPRCYRDPAFQASFESVTRQLTPRCIYDATGIQHLPFNTLYQYALRSKSEPLIYTADASLQFMPDLLHWMLSGVAGTERTNASTSQMVDVRTGSWNLALLDELGLPAGPLRDPSEPGTDLGPIRPDVASATGLPATTRVILPPTHDTAAAVAAVPADASTDWCYLSSGTWSLLGAELDAPCITDAAAAANFTNELGVDGTVRFLKNISGLWLVQRLRREFETEGRSLGYTELTMQAEAAKPMRILIPVADPAFNRPGDLRSAIKAYADQSGQAAPNSDGAFVRCCLESLALEYSRTLEAMERVLGRRFETLHIVGGGCQNRLLNEMTAGATARRVVVGPAEATATGNLLTQAMGLGLIRDLDELRAIVGASTELVTIERGPSAAWDAAFERYAGLPASE
ncbi:MAG: rhamnulokinase [Phycisphaeraceae bacterium]|nr:MAG: rhamnulokinase [Phycisphaeraceae bacterium]